MIPLGDDNSDLRSIPTITYTLIVINLLVFLLELSGGEAFILDWAFIPSHFTANPAANFPSLFTSMFMHGGWAHLIGNMLYLWIFGDNVEDHFGKTKYLVFYLVCGLGATFLQYTFNPTSSLPNVGASGAIAGVLGAYIFQRPQGNIQVMVVGGISQMPALLVIGFWFLLQFFSGIGSLSNTNETGGVAYMAHVGGFLSGLAIAFIFNLTVPGKSR